MTMGDLPRCDGADVGEPYEGLARQLVERVARLVRMRPPHDVSSASRGLPAVMRELMEADGTLTPGEIAQRTGVTDARIANALRVLEERGWVTRAKAEGDRRRVEVALTEAGVAECRRRMDMAERSCAGFLHELGEEDSRQLLHVLQRIDEVLTARSGKKGE